MLDGSQPSDVKSSHGTYVPVLDGQTQPLVHNRRFLASYRISITLMLVCVDACSAATPVAGCKRVGDNTTYARRKRMLPSMGHAHRMVYMLAIGLALWVTAGCADDDTSSANTSTSSDTDNGDAPDGGMDNMDTSMVDDATPSFPCGPELMCQQGDVCIIECLCCGADTGNPDDERSEYSCVTPDPTCNASRPVDCVDQQMLGCFPSEDNVCISPCA